MGKCKSGENLPLNLRRVVLRYKPYLRKSISDAVQTRSEELRSHGAEITWNDVNECVGAVLGELVFGSHDRNLRMEQLSLEAYDKGEFKLLRDVIDELRASIAGSSPA
jgi:hypothetical protein